MSKELDPDFDHSWPEDFFHAEHAHWARATFGPDEIRGPVGPLKHMMKEIQKELLTDDGKELRDSADISEFADLYILWVDAARCAGYGYRQLMGAIKGKHRVNVARKWPQSDPTKHEPVEHVREQEETECNIGTDHRKLLDSLPPYEGGSLLQPKARGADWIDPEVLGLEDDDQD